MASGGGGGGVYVSSLLGRRQVTLLGGNPPDHLADHLPFARPFIMAIPQGTSRNACGVSALGSMQAAGLRHVGSEDQILGSARTK